MLSEFLKRLLFARQFSFINGHIDLFGKSQVLLSSEMAVAVQESNPSKFYETIKRTTMKDIEFYARKLGVSVANMQPSVKNIFETYGLGSLDIVHLDANKKSAILIVKDSAIATTYVNMKKRSAKPVCISTAGVLAGIMSYVFSTDVEAKETKCAVKGDPYCEFIIKYIKNNH